MERTRQWGKEKGTCTNLQKKAGIRYVVQKAGEPTALGTYGGRPEGQTA